MNSSIGISPSVQPQLPPRPTPIGYIATSGLCLLEAGLTLVWTLHAVIDLCRETGQDAALWLIQAGRAPQMVAAIRPVHQGEPSVQWL